METHGWDEIGQIGEDDQLNAGLGHIARSVASFRDSLLSHGFTQRQSFEMSRDFLIELMARGFPAEEEDAE